MCTVWLPGHGGFPANHSAVVCPDHQITEFRQMTVWMTVADPSNRQLPSLVTLNNIIDFNWVCALSSANFIFYELTGAKCASLVPQPDTKRSCRHVNFFLPLALSVILRIRHSGARESWNNSLAVLQCATQCGFDKSSQLFPIPLPLFGKGMLRGHAQLKSIIS